MKYYLTNFVVKKNLVSEENSHIEILNIRMIKTTKIKDIQDQRNTYLTKYNQGRS